MSDTHRYFLNFKKPLTEKKGKIEDPSLKNLVPNLTIREFETEVNWRKLSEMEVRQRIREIINDTDLDKWSDYVFYDKETVELKEQIKYPYKTKMKQVYELEIEMPDKKVDEERDKSWSL